MINNQNDHQIITFTLATPDTELSQLLDETFSLAKKDPEILKRIEQDQDMLAKERKKVRLEDKQWRENQLTPFSMFSQTGTVEINAEDLVVYPGKPRMRPLVVLLFLVLRGFFGGIKTKPTKLLILESATIQNFLFKHHIKMPGWNTITDNINCVSNDTRSYIFDSQLRMVLGEGLDDFQELTIDSTAVSGNTAWPTDSGIIAALTARLWHCGQQLKKFGVPNMQQKRFPNIINTIKKHHQKISMLKGKKGDKARRKKFYRIILKEARAGLKAFNQENSLINQAVAIVDMKPSKKHQLIRLVELIKDDIEKLEQVIGYCDKRINQDKAIPSTEKIMSLSDRDAAYIAKGNRDEVIGYKPQLGRSKQGFVTGLDVPQGNRADSSELVPMVDQHIARTGVVPEIVSVDDGYASAKGKQEVKERGVDVVSISGSKGKKITLVDEWESDQFKTIRADRSAVESLMFTIKYNNSFDRAARREIERVRAEMLEKVVAYNFSRTIEIRNRLEEKNRKAIAC